MLPIPSFDIGLPSLPGAVPCALSNGAPLATHALPGPDASLAHATSLDGDADVYNNMKAPNNCVGVCEGPPFSGSPWTVPAPQHWYATVPPGAEGMAPAKALVAAPLVAPEPLSKEEGVVFGPSTKPQSEAPREMGPHPKAPAVSLGLCSVHAGGQDGNPVLALIEHMCKAPEVKPDDAQPPVTSVKPSPGHAVMCGNAVLLGFSTSLWSSCTKVFQGDAVRTDDFARDFKESASANAEAVTPLGGHWLRHHVLKPDAGSDSGHEVQL